jgi:hypothetical protein
MRAGFRQDQIRDVRTGAPIDIEERKKSAPKKSRKYLKKEKDGFRVFSMRFKKDGDAEERATIVKALKDALELTGCNGELFQESGERAGKDLISAGSGVRIS